MFKAKSRSDLSFLMINCKTKTVSMTRVETALKKTSLKNMIV